MTIIKFEWKKWRKNSKNITILLLVLVSTACFNLYKNNNLAAERENYLEEITVIYNNLNDTIIMKQQSPDQTDVTGNTIDLYKKAMVSLNEEYMGINSDDWRRAIRGFIDYQEHISSLIELGEAPPSNITPDTLNEAIAKDHYFLTHNIQPIRYQTKLTALSSTQLFFESGLGLIFILLLILLFFDIACLEYESSTINFLYTQPFKRSLFIKRKIQVACFIAPLAILTTALTNFLIAWILSKDLGALDYPIVINTSYVLFLWQYLLLMILFALLWSVIVILLVISLSLLTKSSIIVLIISFLVITIPTMLLKFLEINEKIVALIPFTYLSLPNLLQVNEESKPFINTVLLGIVVLSTVILLMSLLIRFLLKRTPSS